MLGVLHWTPEVALNVDDEIYYLARQGHKNSHLTLRRVALLLVDVLARKFGGVKVDSKTIQNILHA